MFSLESFRLSDMTICGTDLRQMGEGVSSSEEVAQRIVSYLYEHFTQKSGEKAFALVRLFMTHRFDELEEPLKRVASLLLPESDARAKRALKCLALMATAGQEADWNDRHKSQNHKVFPLDSEQFVHRFPMIGQLLQQFGADIKQTPQMSQGECLVLDREQHSFNVLYVPVANECAYIHDQEQFIERYKIRSVLGFGGPLSRGSHFAVILFSKVPISKETALMFKPLALSSKNALLQAATTKIFFPREGSNHLRS